MLSKVRPLLLAILYFFYKFHYTTWKRARINSFCVVYDSPQKLFSPQPWNPIYLILTKIPFVILWYVFRIATSIPRQVLLDFYLRSGRFCRANYTYKWQSVFYGGIAPINSVHEMGPKSFKRIYYTNNVHRNFNPTSLTKTCLRAVANTYPTRP